ncbi:MAG: GTP-binding protein, partial [Marinomonas sp.]
LESDLDPCLIVAQGVVDTTNATHDSHDHDHDHDHDHGDRPSQALVGKASDHYVKQQEGMKVMGWQWPQGRIFDESQLRNGLDALMGDPGIYRIKGVFALDRQQALFVNASRGVLSMKMSPWHQTSRCEVIGVDESGWSQKILEFVSKIH